MAVEAEVPENNCSETESDSEISGNEATDEDLAFNQEIEDSQKANNIGTPSIFCTRTKRGTEIDNCHLGL